MTAGHDTITQRPLVGAIDNCKAALANAHEALAVLEAYAPEWCRPYLYGVPGHPSNRDRVLRIGIECPSLVAVIQVGDALCQFDPLFEETGVGASVTVPMPGATVVAYWCGPHRAAA